jgi:hypothetical protein
MFVSRQRDHLGLEPPAVHLQKSHRAVRRAPPLGRAAGIDDPNLPVPLEVREVRVTVDDRVTAWEQGDEPFLPPGARACVVHEPDSYACHLDNPPFGKVRLQRGLVHVPVDGLDRRQRRQLVEHARGDDVTRVQDQVDLAEPQQALVRKPPRSARQVCVRDDRDPRQL